MDAYCWWSREFALGSSIQEACVVTYFSHAQLPPPSPSYEYDPTVSP